MGKPSARVGDHHICPMIDGPKPHVGGPIMPPGKLTVLIGGKPAATATNLCVCVSPVPDIIVQGSPTVLIGGLPAARLFDSTGHGGSIAFGAGSVLIGEFAAIAAIMVFPGKQSYGNCGIQSCQQIIHQATDTNIMEAVILAESIKHECAINEIDNPARHGGTDPWERQKILEGYGVSSDIILEPNRQDLADAIKENKGIIASVDVSILWGNNTFKGGHSINITEGDFDENGELTHIYINDTGNGKQGLRMDVDDFMKSIEEFKYACLNVTTEPIWTQFPPKTLKIIQGRLTKKPA